jgi:hypothetical protein
MLSQALLGPDPQRAEQSPRMEASAIAEAFAVLASLRSALVGGRFLWWVYLIR